MSEEEFKAAMEQVNSVMDNYESPYKGALRDICEAIGYGRSMSLISEWWGLKLGGNGGEFVVGTCKALTVPCGCDDQPHCDWCCGCGWLTKHVKSIKDRE
jgi:hypothetical protein